MPLGAHPAADGTSFSVWSGAADRVWVSLFDGKGKRETARVELARSDDGTFSTTIPNVAEGTPYGFRADGRYAPDEGFWFDPARLLIDPYALEIDRPYACDPRLALPRGEIDDTAPLMPKSVVSSLGAPLKPLPPVFKPGGLIYELQVRAFTMLHPQVPEKKRGTIAALAEPVVIEHLQKLGVGAVELMPVTAWIDERHLPPLGLRNAWGYNPVTYMALDPRLAPGGLAELRETVAALREAGIGTILDVVFNHTGESDRFGATLSLRGLDARAYLRHAGDDTLVNDTGTGNTLNCDHPVVRRMVLDSLRHFVLYAGVDGFRFDLAPILGRDAHGFSQDAALIREMLGDDVLADRVMIAEPWDIGPGGYQLGNFPAPFLEWNDRYRDDVRRFWRGDAGMIGALATRLAGSSDIFARSGQGATRSVNFVAAHDGMALADLTAYAHKHNEANGEDNRDGHDENLSWNHGIEGSTDDPGVTHARRHDIKALLGTLFASAGTIMLTAGDEFSRTQRGNNNAYAQDNAITWLDWENADVDLLDHARMLSTFRRQHLAAGSAFLTDAGAAWLTPQGEPMSVVDWERPDMRQLVLLRGATGRRSAVLINGGTLPCWFHLPARDGFVWKPSGQGVGLESAIECPARSVVFCSETPA